jgi:hypothetical protein
VFEILGSGFALLVLIVIPLIALLPDLLLVGVRESLWPGPVQLHRMLASHPHKAFLE